MNRRRSSLKIGPLVGVIAAVIGATAAYTAFVVQKLTATAGPTITLNTDYQLTDVPVPDGIRGVGQIVTLVQ